MCPSSQMPRRHLVPDVKFILLANNVTKATASIISMLSFAILKGFHSNLLIAVP